MLRPRLFERLDDMRHAPVTWISGPPGAGKTTLVSSWLAERRLVGLWLRIDAGDADVATFFHYLGLAARHLMQSGGPALPSLTPHHLAGLTGFTRRYAEALSAGIGGPAVLVLDNCELVPPEAALHEVIRDLASSLAPGLRMIMMSRADPPRAYARLRLNEDLVLLDGRELDLHRDEAVALASARGPDAAAVPDAGRIDRLLSQTQGWLAGFVLLLADRGGHASESAGPKTRQLLFDYFATELLGRFEPAMRLALLRTALLPTMTVANAESITGDPSIGAVLADLHRQNCFVAEHGRAGADAVDSAGVTEYEYHALFRAFLLDRAVVTIPPEEWRHLQVRAADLLRQSNQADAAAGLYEAARHWPGLAALVSGEASSLVSSGRHRTLQRWLADMPSDVFDQSPWLEYWRAAAWLPFDPARARGFLERAYAGFEASDDAPGLYSAWAGAMESFFFEWRDFRPADRWIAEFARLHARHPDFSSAAVELRTYWAMGTLVHRQPQHPLLPAWCERATALLDASHRDLSVLLGGYMIIWLLWRGETDRARRIVERIAPWIDDDMSPMVLILWRCARGFVHSVSGRTDACRESIEAGLQIARRSRLHTFDFLLSAQMARCCLVAGDPVEAETWIASMAGAMRSHSHIDGAFYRHLQCNAAAQRGDWRLALDHGQAGLALALESGVPFLEATSHVSLARVYVGNGTDSTISPEVAGRHADHVASARAIGRAMDSRVIECLCLEAEAAAAFRNGQDGTGLDCLSRALVASRAMDGATWRIGGPQANALLYERALEAGIEVDHVHELILRHRIRPHDPATVGEAWPWPIRIHTLGRFEIVRDGEPLRSKGKPQHKPLELLGCLCAFGGRAVHQDRVADALWPDTDGDAADQALRTTLHRLRKLLRSDEAVQIENGHLSLDPLQVWVDCFAFDRAAKPVQADPARLLRATTLYRGPFLESESRPWATACRERLRAQFCGITERLGDLLEQAGDWPAAADCWQRGIEEEPLAEGFYRRAMKALSRLGRRPEALAVYRRCQRTMLAGQEVSPTPQTQALYRELTDDAG